MYRAIDPPRASARSRYRPPPEEFVPSPFVMGRSTRTGNPSHEEAPSRVVPRELYPGNIVPEDASSPLPFNKNPKLRTFALLQSRLIYWTIVSPASLVSQVVGDERPAPESPRLSVSCKITPGVS